MARVERRLAVTSRETGGRQGRGQTADWADWADSRERSGSSRGRQQTWPKQQPGGVEQGAGRAGGGARWSRSAEL
jgi:hypothetical protein